VKNHWNIIYVDIAFRRLNQEQVEVIIKDNYKYNAETAEVKKIIDTKLMSILSKKLLLTCIPVHVADGDGYEGYHMSLKKINLYSEDIQRIEINF